MAQLGRFFDGPEYGAQDFAEFFTNFLRTGYFEGLRIETNNSMEVILKPGSAFVEGYEYRNTSDLSLTVLSADPLINRIDRLVIRLDRTPDAPEKLTALIRRGNSEPAELIRNESIYEISIAQIQVESGKSYIEQYQITDERNRMEVCGPAIPNGQMLPDNYLDSNALMDEYPHGFSTMRVSDNFGGFPTIAGQVQTNRASEEVAAQFYFSSLADRPFLYVRTTFWGEWTPWRRIDGAAFISGNGDRLQSGSDSVSASASGVTSKNVAFPVPFSTPPHIVVSIVTSNPQTSSASAGNITTTGFTLYVHNSLTSSRSIICNWHAKGGD
ncbi:H-type lectin domain-containing protein [Paucisalibacillus globulus]|uniref:H-type lectin domain-containing protein n=1 Tax=Paucisalibacillus globulus TaxID=351095 RepID=UPI0003FF33A0|nr:H-type lectin domain-containing protein [Paucisalibacillus globulus]